MINPWKSQSKIRADNTGRKPTICRRLNRMVLVEDCEQCQSERKCPPLCFKRGFVWGMPDDAYPLWDLTISEARRSKEEVSYLYREHETYAASEYKNTTILIYRKKIIPVDLRWKVWERDNFTCKICNSRQFLSVDHIKPESLGGLTEEDNLQTLCKRCNSQKGAKWHK